MSSSMRFSAPLLLKPPLRHPSGGMLVEVFFWLTGTTGMNISSVTSIFRIFRVARLLRLVRFAEERGIDASQR